MKPDTELADPLSSAIRALRAELLVWIDTELVRLREGAQAANRLLEEKPAAGSQFGCSSSHLGTRARRPHLQLGPGRRESRPREKFVERNPTAEAGRLPDDVPTPSTEPNPPGSASGPRQRLDALARMLDHRLKRVQAAAGTRGAAGDGRDHDESDDVSAERSALGGPR
jgi:hypothetical protein